MSRAVHFGARRLDASRLAKIGIAPSLAVAGGIHLGLAAQHGLSGQHGTLFLVAGLSQAALAGTISRRLAHWNVVAAVVLSATVIGAWVAVRLPDVVTGGETFGILELVAGALEAVTVVFGLVLLRRRAVARTNHVLRPVGLCAAVIFGATATMLGGSSHGDHHHRHAHAGEAPRSLSSAVDEADDADPVFGDLFADHNGDHDECAHGRPPAQSQEGSASHCAHE